VGDLGPRRRNEKDVTVFLISGGAACRPAFFCLRDATREATGARIPATLTLHRPSLTRPALFLFCALFLAATVAGAGEDGKRAAAPPAGPEAEEDSPDLVRQRILLYLQRHGDNGRIDPERRREKIAAEYALWRQRAGRRGGKSAEGVGGSEWTSLGPTNGAGRMTAVAPHPTDSNKIYAGAAGGGVWKSIDAGATWTPLTEGLSDLSVGALAVAPSSPDTVYLGTGEGGYAIDFIPGIGFLKSTDGGVTWNLPSSVIATTFYRISVHPTNANELVAGTNGGAFRSTDGGNTWTNVITRAAYGDVPDLARDANDPRILYATTWCRSNACTNTTAKVLKSTDGGATWTDKSSGLPVGIASGIDERMSIALAPSNPSVLYAARSLRNGAGNLVSHMYKSSNGGDSWTELTAISGSSRLSSYLAQQGWYNNVLVVSPTDANVVIGAGTNYVRSTDGGTTFQTTFSGAGVHVDVHDLRYQGSKLWIANDGGIWASTDDAQTATERNAGLVTRQYYSLAIDPVNRNRIIAGAQDNGTSQRTDGGGTEWRSIIGSDGFECGVNPIAPAIAWGTTQFGNVFRTRGAGSTALPSLENVTPPYDDGEQTPFLSILKVDPWSPNTIYTGSYRLWRSRDGGNTWVPLPTTTTDTSGWLSTTTVTSIALARTDPLMILVGKGRAIFRSGDGGTSWVGASGLPNAVVNNVEIDPRNANVAWAAIATTTGPSVYRSDSGGVAWSPSATGLPAFAAQAVRVDPTDSNVVYCGTDVGVYRSTDAGATWSRFGNGLPSTSVHDLALLPDGSMLRVATHGRGIWELQVPPIGNSQPVATITAPAATSNLSRGTTLNFSGTVSDPDPGDSATGTWFFPDTAEAVPLPAGAGVVTHTFRNAGVYPVTLTARDTRGALGSTSVLITISESGDACTAPIVIPAAGPFPYSVTVNNESATSQPSDPAPACVGVGTGTAGSIWFEFTPPTGGSWEFSTCGALADTVVSVYTGAACGPYTLVTSGCSDDTTLAGCGAQASIVTVTATAGQTLRIQATGFSANSVGSFPLTVRTSATNGPRISGISIPEGPAPGGTTVLITGRGFAPGMTVEFGGVPATDVVIYGPTTLSATTPPHAPGSVDVTVRADVGAGTLAAGFAYTAFVPTPCVANASTLCLNGGRFKVQVAWKVPTNGTGGDASAVPLTSDTGYFWFFSANNIELVVKVVDGRPVNGKFWVFYGALSNVEYFVTVTDTQTGAVKVYSNPSGQQSSVADTLAF
jgi:photosystem II stability/assembly factor-like uncharacterized protein